jgi:integrase/recombinase XerD
MQVTTQVILELRKPRADGKFPVKLRITFRRDRHYYTLRTPKNESIYLSEVEFSKLMGDRPGEKFKDLRIHLNEQEKIARDVAGSLPIFSFDAFERKYFGAGLDEQDLFSCLASRANVLRSEGRISTAVSNECALKSLRKYTGKTSLYFDRVDIHFLTSYENWMLSSQNSSTTVGIYLRNVRAAFNEAAKIGAIKPGQYPFGKDKFVIPSGKNVKKALSHKDVGLIANYALIDGSNLHRYRDYWLFSYLCNGINIKDMARLKYSNIDGDVIKIIRAKTQREKKNDQRPITIIITKEIGRIIDRWGNKPGLPDTFIFPILETGITPNVEYARIQQATKMINKYIGDISKALEISQKVTSYTARHSFATVLKRSGASMEFISESLGHHNLQTTENYLADFEIEEKRKWAEKLTKF